MAKRAVFLFLVLQTVRLAAWREIQSPQCNGIIHGTVFDLSGERVKNLKVEAWPLGVDLAVVLPNVETDDAGEYRFQNLCSGKYTVIPFDQKAGYGYSTPYLNEFLYGTRIAEVRLITKHPQAELLVHLPPKPGFMEVLLINRETKTKVLTFTVKLKVPGQHRRPEAAFDFDMQMSDDTIPIPPDNTVIVHVTADGFHEWSQSAGHGKRIRVPSGTYATLEGELEPKAAKPNVIRHDGFR